MKWIKASERLPDSPDHWLANNKQQEGKVVHCRVNGKDGIGYFGRVDNKLHFWYACFSHTVSSITDAYWSTNDNGYVDYNNFHTIEWLDEHPSSDQCPEINHSPVVVHEIPDEGEDAMRFAEFLSINGWCFSGTFGWHSEDYQDGRCVPIEEVYNIFKTYPVQIIDKK